MKRMISLLSIAILLIITGSCSKKNETKEYSLDIVDEYNLEATSLQKKCEEGTKITILADVHSDYEPVVFIDNLFYLSGTINTDGKYEFTTYMPTHDLTIKLGIKLESFNKSISYYDDQVLSKDYQDEINYNFCLRYNMTETVTTKSYIRNYLGTYNQAVAMVLNSNISSSDDNKILMYVNQKFYDIDTAIMLNIISNEDLKKIDEAKEKTDEISLESHFRELFNLNKAEIKEILYVKSGTELAPAGLDIAYKITEENYIDRLEKSILNSYLYKTTGEILDNEDYLVVTTNTSSIKVSLSTKIIMDNKTYGVCGYYAQPKEFEEGYVIKDASEEIVISEIGKTNSKVPGNLSNYFLTPYQSTIKYLETPITLNDGTVSLIDGEKLKFNGRYYAIEGENNFTHLIGENYSSKYLTVKVINGNNETEYKMNPGYIFKYNEIEPYAHGYVALTNDGEKINSLEINKNIDLFFVKNNQEA